MNINLLFISFLVSGLGAWSAIKFGTLLGLVDVPNNRSSHDAVIPSCAGIGIMAAFGIASFMLKLPLYLWLTSIGISFVSLWGGDKHRLSAKTRLIIQFCCSLLFLWLLFLGEMNLGTFALCALLSVYIVGTSNFYNFMDGIDGIAGITGVVAFGLLAFYGRLIGADQIYQTLCLVMVFACLGFLCFNIPRAKVFLGDVGSVLLGFVFSCLVILLSSNVTDFIVLTGFMAPFYLDELLTMFFRIKNGDSLLVAHRKHIYQLLANEAGISHWKISLGYGCFQAIIGLTAIFLRANGPFYLVSVYLVYGLFFIIFSVIVRQRFPLYED